MKFTMYVSEEDKENLEYEVISRDLRSHLTRILDRDLSRFFEDGRTRLMWQNRLINISRGIVGKAIYVLKSDDFGEYQPAEYAWHNGEFGLMLLRPNTLEFVELICSLVEGEFLTIDELNLLFEKDGLSFTIEQTEESVKVQVASIEDLETKEISEEHPNIRVLVKRMNDALEAEDYGGLLHASASVFETMAKDIVGIPGVQNQTLGSFFKRYRKDSTLPSEILDYILGIYDARNVTPLAGHGSTKPPEITREQAIALAELTKAFVRIEYLLTAEARKMA